GYGPSAENGEWKIPGSDNGGDSARQVTFDAHFPGYILRQSAVSQASHLLRIESTKVNRFYHVRIGFRPGFAYLEDFPSREFESRGAHFVGQSFEALAAELCRASTPGRERLPGCSHGVDHVCSRPGGHLPDFLFWLSWIDGDELARPMDLSATNHQGIGPSKLSPDNIEGLPHLLACTGETKIGRRFILEMGFLSCWEGGGFCGSFLSPGIESVRPRS